MSEVKGTHQNNLEWARCKHLNIPFVVLRVRSTRGDLDFDMWTCDKNLTDEGRDKVSALFMELLNLDPRGRTWTMGHETGVFPKVKLDLARDYLPKLAEIVRNPVNQCPIFTEQLGASGRWIG